LPHVFAARQWACFFSFADVFGFASVSVLTGLAEFPGFTRLAEFPGFTRLAEFTVFTWFTHIAWFGSTACGGFHFPFEARTGRDWRAVWKAEPFDWGAYGSRSQGASRF
jgi:hypothetical protein